MCVWVVWRETMNLLADLLRDYSNRRPDLIKPVKTSDETRSTLIDFFMKWREIVQWWSSSLAKLYRMELYDWYKKENKSTNTHKIERLLSRGGTEKFILFLLLDWEIVGIAIPYREHQSLLWRHLCGNKKEKQTSGNHFQPQILNRGQKKEKHTNEVIIFVDLSGTIGQNSRLASRMEPLDQYEGKRPCHTVLNNVEIEM